MQDAHLQVFLVSEATVRLAFRHSKDILTLGWNPLPHVKQFERLWIYADYPETIQELGSLDDEIQIGFLGKSEKEIRQAVVKRLRGFVRDNTMSQNFDSSPDEMA